VKLKPRQIDEEVARFMSRKPINACAKSFRNGEQSLMILAHLLSQQESVQGEELRTMLAAATPAIAA
jgi:hypothetical protein